MSLSAPENRASLRRLAVLRSEASSFSSNTASRHFKSKKQSSNGIGFKIWSYKLSPCLSQMSMRSCSQGHCRSWCSGWMPTGAQRPWKKCGRRCSPTRGSRDDADAACIHIWNCLFLSTLNVNNGSIILTCRECPQGSENFFWSRLRGKWFLIFPSVHAGT